MHSGYEAAAHRKALRRARAPGATSKALHEERLLEKAAEYQESGRSSVRFCHPNKWSPDSQCLRRVDTYLFPNGFSGVEARCCHHCLSPFQQTATSLTPLASFQARKTFRLALTKTCSLDYRWPRNPRQMHFAESPPRGAALPLVPEGSVGRKAVWRKAQQSQCQAAKMGKKAEREAVLWRSEKNGAPPQNAQERAGG